MEKKRDSFFLANKKQINKESDAFKQNKQNDNKQKRQNNVDKNRNGLETEEKIKKPFDKKSYRLKKYSNKYKLEQWEAQRKKKLLRDYYKEIKKDPLAGSYTQKAFDEDTTDSQEVGKYVRHPDKLETETSVSAQNNKTNKKDSFQRAKEHFNKLKQEKEDKKKQIEKAKEERKQKLVEYKKKKQEKFKKLSKKTKKGQPVMTGRLEILLDKIQKGK